MTTLTTTDAARYLGMTVGQFRRAVDRGEVPQPVIRCRPARWARRQLDAVLDGAVSKGASSPDVDLVMEAIRCASR